MHKNTYNFNPKTFVCLGHIEMKPNYKLESKKSGKIPELQIQPQTEAQIEIQSKKLQPQAHISTKQINHTQLEHPKKKGRARNSVHVKQNPKNKISTNSINSSLSDANKLKNNTVLKNNSTGKRKLGNLQKYNTEKEGEIKKKRLSLKSYIKKVNELYNEKNFTNIKKNKGILQTENNKINCNNEVNNEDQIDKNSESSFDINNLGNSDLSPISPVIEDEKEREKSNKLNSIKISFNEDIPSNHNDYNNNGDGDNSESSNNSSSIDIIINNNNSISNNCENNEKKMKNKNINCNYTIKVKNENKKN